MPKIRVVKGRTQTLRRKQTVARELAQVKSSFESAFAILDSAVSGALIAGMPPAAIEPVLAFWFMKCALVNRGRTSPDQFEQSRREIMQRFDSIVDEIKSYVDEVKPNDDDEPSELDTFRTDYGVNPSDVDMKAYETQSTKLVECVFQIILRRSPEFSTMAIEMMFLMEWLKVAALNNVVRDECYLTMRETIPLMYELYDPLLEHELSRRELNQSN